jgi:putative membrane protein
MAVSALQQADRDRIVAAIVAAEAGTAGEIYVVVSHEAVDFRFIPVLWAALAALPIPWPLHLLTTWSTTTILIVQALTFVAVASVASLWPLRRALVPASIAADAVRKDAHAQFLAHGIHLTEARTGVLIYVALAERRVEIVADDGIHRKVDQSAWDALARAVADAAKAGRLAEGIVNAVHGAGALLARHFPPPPVNRNELPDRVVEI